MRDGNEWKLDHRQYGPSKDEVDFHFDLDPVPCDHQLDLIAALGGWQNGSMTHRGDCGLDVLEIGRNGSQRRLAIERVVSKHHVDVEGVAFADTDTQLNGREPAEVCSD